ncbi:MAG: S8 family peptidase [Chloroflexota bacterium]
MHTGKVIISAVGLVSAALIILSTLGPAQASVPQADGDLKPRAYLPFLARSYVQARYPSDPDYTYQWALPKINAPHAWGLSTGDDVVIAILDTGVDLDHPDLSSKVLTHLDKNFLNGNPSAEDDHGHGTHVAGTAAATTDNAIGIAGMGWHAAILPLKVLDASGNGTAEHIAEAIRYATDHGAGVINMSLAGTTDPCCHCPSVIQKAVDYAYAKGTLLTAAAGNDLGATEMFPANCEHVLGVAATDANDAIACYSNYGTHVSVAAPGSGIYSTIIGGSYYHLSGTSMATPHVSGLAALLLARYPAYSPDQVASAILDNALDLGPTGWDADSGCGRIDAFQALSNGALATAPLCLQAITTSTKAHQRTAPDAAFAPGEIIVEFDIDPAAEPLWRRYTKNAEFLPSLRVWRLRVPIGQELVILARLNADPDVLHADLNYVVVAQD